MSARAPCAAATSCATTTWARSPTARSSTPGTTPRAPGRACEAGRPALPLPSLRTGLSLPTDLPQLRPAGPALLPPRRPTPELPDPKSLKPESEPLGPSAPAARPPGTGIFYRILRSRVGTDHALPSRPAHLHRRNPCQMALHEETSPKSVDACLPPPFTVPSGKIL